METALLVLEPFTFPSQIPMFLLLPCLQGKGEVSLPFRKRKGAGKRETEFSGSLFVERVYIAKFCKYLVFITGVETVSLKECLVPV